MQPLGIGRDRRNVVWRVEDQRQPSPPPARPHDLELLLQLAAQVHGGDVHGDLACLDARQVEELLRHAEHAL